MGRTAITDKNLILIGAGHSNLHLVKNGLLLRDNGYKVTLISPTDLRYNGVAPGVVSNYYPREFGKISSKCLLDKVNGKFIREKVIRIDINQNKVYFDDDRSFPFDYLSINIGASVPIDQIPGSFEYSYPIRPIEHLWQFTEELRSLISKSPHSISVVIIGGGAAGVEIAGNVHQLITSSGRVPKVSIFTKGEAILSQFSSSASIKVSKLFQKRGIDIRINSKVHEIKKNRIILESSDEFPFDLCVLAAGIIPNKIDIYGFLSTTELGELIVNPFLQCNDNPWIFASGDCCFFEVQPLWKSGYHAINQGPVLLKNLIALSKGSQLHKYSPSKRVITALNLGMGKGLLVYGKYTSLSKLSFRVKDFIERRYIKSFMCKKKK